MVLKLGYLGVRALPVSAFVSSFIQQLLLEMHVSGVKLANSIERDVLRRSNEIVYERPEFAERNNARMVPFSRAGYSQNNERKKVDQKGRIYGIPMGVKKDSIFHAIGWTSFHC